MKLIPRLLVALTLLGAVPALEAQGAGYGPQADSTLKDWLRQLVVRQETYYSEHGTYTTDVAALGLFTRPGPAAANTKPDSIYVEVIQAGGRSWWGRGSYRGQRGKSCIIWVGTPTDFPAPPTTDGTRLHAPEEGKPVCDKF